MAEFRDVFACFRRRPGRIYWPFRFIATRFTVALSALLAARCQSDELVCKLHAVGDVDVGRLEVVRPGRSATVHPGGAQPRGARGRDNEARIIADVEDRARLESQTARQVLEAAGMRLGDADLARVQRNAEAWRQTDQLQIRVPIAERRQRIARAQTLERGLNVGLGLELVARGEEHLEGALGHRFLVAAFARVRRERADAQIGEVVRVVRLGSGEPLARGAHLLDR